MKRGSKLLALWALGVYLLLYLPIVVMAVNSFNASVVPNRWGGFTFQWYLDLWKDEEILQAFVTSLGVSAVSTVFATILGTSAALGMRPRRAIDGAARKLNAADWLESVLMFPVILPDIVLGISLLLLFVLMRIHLGALTIVLAHVTFSMVYVFLVVRVRLRGLDPALEEAARDLGAGPLRTFFLVTLPLILPGVVAGALLGFTLSFEDFLITFFTAGVGVTTLPLQIYSMMKFGVSPVISALSTGFLVLTVAVTMATQRWQPNR